MANVTTLVFDKDSSLDEMGRAYRRSKLRAVETRRKVLGCLLSPYWEANYAGPFISEGSGAGIEQRIYLGEYQDSTLSYLNARYMDNARGQFLSQDPLVVAFTGSDKQLLNDPQQLNSYSYARNNPLTLVDATGRKVYLAAYNVFPERATSALHMQNPPMHLYYYIQPDNPYRVTESIAAGQGAFSLGAGPGEFNTPIGGGIDAFASIFFGNLASRIGTANNPNKDFTKGIGLGAAGFTEIHPNTGQSDEDLIKGLLQGYLHVGSGIDYRALSNQGGKYNGNSNNFAYTLAQYAGVTNQFNNFASNFYAPGSNARTPTSGGVASYYGVSGSTQVTAGNLGSVVGFLSAFISR